MSRLPFFLTAGRNVEAPRQNRVSRKRLESTENQPFVRKEILPTLRGMKGFKDEVLSRALPFSPHPAESRTYLYHLDALAQAKP